jgi:hypothetical protein
MKSHISFFLLLALFFGITAQKAKAQNTVTAQAFAEVIEALTATETSQLNFGKFSPQVQGGQVTVTPEGQRNKTGSVILSGLVANSGIFHLTGAPNASYSVQIPSTPATLIHQNSNSTMTVSNWVSVPPSGSGTGLLANGEQYVYLGATLQVGSLLDNPVGLYSGTYNLTFAYN